MKIMQHLRSLDDNIVTDVCAILLNKSSTSATLVYSHTSLTLGLHFVLFCTKALELFTTIDHENSTKRCTAVQVYKSADCFYYPINNEMQNQRQWEINHCSIPTWKG